MVSCRSDRSLGSIPRAVRAARPGDDGRSALQPAHSLPPFWAAFRVDYNNVAYDHHCHPALPRRRANHPGVRRDRGNRQSGNRQNGYRQSGYRRRGSRDGGNRLTDLQRDLLFLLHDLGRLLRVDADKRARAKGMTRAQWGILLWLERQPGISQKELAELLEVEPISVARLVDRLEGRGMVERRPDPKDRRIWRLHLCPPAHPELQEIRRHRAAMARRLTAGIDPAALDAMVDVLITMKTALAHETMKTALAHDPRAGPATPPLLEAREVA